MKRISVYLFVFIVSLVSASFLLSGCTFIFQKGRRSDTEKIEQLNRQLDDLKQTQALLQDRLAQEIKDKQVRLAMMEKGLVITFVADVLFDSGKAKIKPEAYPTLDKVATVLRENVPEFSVGIEGHTDNQPIKFSGWKSNWELSAARALSVLHYLADAGKLSGDRLSAIGYGEYRPVATNDTKEGRQLNRRVEVVILPRVTKVKNNADKTVSVPASPAAAGVSEPQENLK
ncbi:MAG TPA: OmpA family protein [Patescibacteria group bacterium]|nr:OmpA family protein [Patescibacteria group bacterium]